MRAYNKKKQPKHCTKLAYKENRIGELFSGFGQILGLETIEKKSKKYETNQMSSKSYSYQMIGLKLNPKVKGYESNISIEDIQLTY